MQSELCDLSVIPIIIDHTVIDPEIIQKFVKETAPEENYKSLQRERKR